MRFIKSAFFIVTVFFLSLSFQKDVTATSLPDRGDFETDFKITVKSRDAKFIGSSMGGARITIRDRRTGDIIVSGVTSGTTGDTEKIMGDAVQRDEVIWTEGAAAYEFSIELFEPTPVTITATAPLAQPQSIVSVSEDMILFPQKDYASGNGIMLEIPGFAVDIIAPRANVKTLHNPEEPVLVKANVLKMCGCHIDENGLWPASRYDVEIHLYKDTRLIASYPMEYSGTESLFAKKVRFPLDGTYKIAVTAFDKVTKESGMDMTSILIAKAENN